MELFKNKTFLLILSLIIGVQATFGQRNFVEMGQSVDGVPVMVQYDEEEEENKIEGSPYLFDEWKHFNIKKKNGSVFEAPTANYHIYLNQLIVQFEQKFHRIHDSNQIEYFEVDTVKFVSLDAKEGGITFAKLLVDSEKIQLLKWYSCNIKKGKPNQGIVEATDDKYVRFEEYLIKGKDDNRLSELKVKRKGAKLKDSEKFPDLAEYLDENKKENFKNEKNLIEILKGF